MSSLKEGNRQYRTNKYIVCHMAINAMKKAIKKVRVIARRQSDLLSRVARKGFSVKRIFDTGADNRGKSGSQAHIFKKRVMSDENFKCKR